MIEIEIEFWNEEIELECIILLVEEKEEDNIVVKYVEIEDK